MSFARHRKTALSRMETDGKKNIRVDNDMALNYYSISLLKPSHNVVHH